MKKALKIFLILVLLFGLFLGCRQLYHNYMQTQYPLTYEEYVSKAEKEYGIPKETIFAVIKAESSFREDAVSSSGAVGLMQILPDTMEWLCQKRGENYSEEMLYDPAVNIDYGCFYLSYLYESFQDWDLAHAAYNAGPNKVRSWMEDEALFQDGKLISIPYKETETYLQRIHDYKNTYIKYYASKGWNKND